MHWMNHDKNIATHVLFFLHHLALYKPVVNSLDDIYMLSVLSSKHMHFKELSAVMCEKTYLYCTKTCPGHSQVEKYNKFYFA